MATRSTRSRATGAQRGKGSTASSVNLKKFRERVMALVPEGPAHALFDQLRDRLLSMMPEMPRASRAQASTRRAAKKPATKKPATKKPATKKPAAKKPARGSRKDKR